MMSFCKRSLHSLLGLSTASLDDVKCHHVVESAPVKPPPQENPVLDDIGDGVDGLASCTESLGFESSDERRISEGFQGLSGGGNLFSPAPARPRKKREGRVMKSYPPPISSLNQNGRPNFFLRPVRKDGRLKLMEVRTQRPEILRASRQDGRLTLQIFREDDYPEDDVQEEEQEEEAVEEERVESWRLPASGGDSGFRRCNELITAHHHHDLNVWSQRCVSTR